MAEFLTHPALPARHGFFTRRGGVSGGAYASLNCGPRSADDPAHVAENRAHATHALVAAPERLVGL
ncbi:MAG: laccase domain-containing protein, partial [Roseococcus sp.]